MKFSFLLLSITFSSFLSTSSTDAQEDNANLEIRIDKVYPPFPIDTKQIETASTLLDLNKKFEYWYIKEYISVEIVTKHDEQLRSSFSQDNVLTKEQKQNMLSAHPKDPIYVKVKYIPDNTLSHNEIHTLDFYININPHRDAKYPGGHDSMQKFLHENILRLIPEKTFEGYAMAALSFTINNDGQIINQNMNWSSNNPKVDALLLESICDMPPWLAAEYADGTKTQQDYVLRIGNMESCVSYLFNLEFE